MPEELLAFGVTRNTYTKAMMVVMAKSYALNSDSLAGVLETVLEESIWSEYNSLDRIYNALRALEGVDRIARTGHDDWLDNNRSGDGTVTTYEYTMGAWVREGLNGFTKKD